jgi:hypothetical protein
MPFTETTTINVILSTIILKFLEPTMGSGTKNWEKTRVGRAEERADG